MWRSRSLRTRLTLGFAAALAVTLAVIAALVFFLFSAAITTTIDSGLRQRQSSLVRLAAQEPRPDRLRADSGERILQIYDTRGAVRASTLEVEEHPLLTPAEVARARRAPFNDEREDIGDGEEGRIRAFPLPGGRYVAALGESLDRYHDLRLRLAILLIAAIAVIIVVAATLAYRLAGAALGPVERMRGRAAELTETDLHERLPVPATEDEIARLGRTFNELLDRLATAVERERRLVSDASHELRTPLAVLRAELEVASRRNRTPEQLASAIASALEETHRLTRLADDLLVLARSDQGRLPLRLEPVEVLDALTQAEARNAAMVAAAGRELRADVDIPGGAVVLADPDRLGQLLDNLVANALRHGAGAIVVHAAVRDDGRIVIDVSDEGPGFGPALPQAFERFSQGEPGHGGPGSGLGLAIVRAIARAHGGEAWAEDLPAGGARVGVVLPAA
jgi:two-component system OmpR family sensor kinase